MMWNPNRPAHAAQKLNSADPPASLPNSYAWWLQQREELRKLYPTGREPA